MAVINEEKYNSFNEIRELEELSNNTEGLSIQNVEIKSPDNPANLKRAKLIIFRC